MSALPVAPIPVGVENLHTGVDDFHAGGVEKLRGELRVESANCSLVRGLARLARPARRMEHELHQEQSWGRSQVPRRTP